MKATDIRRVTQFALQTGDFQRGLVEVVSHLLQSKTLFARLRIIGKEIGRYGNGSVNGRETCFVPSMIYINPEGMILL